MTFSNQDFAPTFAYQACLVHKPSKTNRFSTRLFLSFVGKPIVLLFFWLSVTGISGQIAQWNFEGTTNVASTVDANVTVSVASFGSGVTAISYFAGNPGDAYAASSWGTTASISADDYIEFTITPNAGCTFDLTNISFDTRRSTSGPASWALRSSADGYAADLSTGTTGTGFGVNSVGLSVSGQSTALTYRIYGYGASGTGTLRFDNVTFAGTSGCGGCSSPSTQDSMIVFSAVGESSLTVSWTESATGSGSIVIINTSNSFTNPVDGTDPAANAVYGGSGEQVVYNGAGNTVNITGLSASTEYWFRVYSYNCSGAGIMFNTNTATNNPLNQTTTAPSSCTAIFSDDFGSGLGLWSNTGNWLNTGGEMQTNGSVAATEYAYTDIGLQDLTSGDYEWEFCMRWITTDPSSGNNFEFFLISNDPDLSGTPNGYSVGVNRVGSSDLLVLYEVTGGAPTAIITSAFDWNANDDVCIRVTRTAGGDWTLYYDPNGTGEVNAGTINETSYTSGNYIGPVNEHSVSYPDQFFIDDVSMCGGSPCTDPAPTLPDSAIIFTAITDNSMTISWTQSSDASGSIVLINTSNSFTNPTNGTDPTANSIYGGSGEQVIYRGAGNSATVTGLSSNTEYWFRVYAFNCAGDSIKFNTTSATNNPNFDTTLTAIGAATELNFRVIPTVCTATNSTFAVKVCATDASFNMDTSFSSNITLSINTQPGGATLSGTTTQTAQSGCAVFDDISLDVIGSYLLNADAGALSGISDTISISSSCTGQTVWEGLIINEFSNGSANAEEYYEFVVAGICGQSVDIRNFILDDNNGTFTNAWPQSSGVAQGHYRFKDVSHWRLIPVGSIIVIYNADDKNASLTLADDPYDANGDSLYIIPHNNNVLFERCTSLPYYSGVGDNDSSYSPCTYTSVSGTNWASTLGIANTNDAVQVRSPDGSYFHGVSYGSSTIMTGGPDSLHVKASTGQDFAFFFNGGDYRDVANWSYGSSDPSGSANETPGTFNNASNEAWVKSIRDAGAGSCPIAPISALALGTIALDAKITGKSVALNWIDKSGFYSKSYSVLRSKDGENFYPIATKDNMDPEIVQFQYTDNVPLKGFNYYKIQSGVKKSNVAKIDFEDGFTLMGIYPNPANNEINISLTSKESTQVRIRLINILSQESLEMDGLFSGNNVYRLNTEHLANGIYTIEIITKSSYLREKVEISR